MTKLAAQLQEVRTLAVRRVVRAQERMERATEEYEDAVAALRRADEARLAYTADQMELL